MKKLLIITAVIIFKFDFYYSQSTTFDISFEIITKKYECRYCNAKGFSQKVDTKSIKFIQEEYYEEYNEAVFFVMKQEVVSQLLNFKNLPKVCDISNTGKHGIEIISEESNLNEELIPFLIKDLDKINKQIKKH